MVLNETGPKDHMGPHSLPHLVLFRVAFITMRSFKDLYRGTDILKPSGSGTFWGSVNRKHNVMVSSNCQLAESRVACKMGLCVCLWKIVRIVVH